MRASTRSSARVTTIVGLAVILCLSAGPSFGHPGPLTRQVHTAGSNIGDGLYTLTTVQKVTGAAYFDNFNCRSQAQFGWCVDAVGATYIPSANLTIVSEECPPAAGCNESRNVVAEFVGTNTSLNAPLLPLGCIPGVPYYPGAGDDYYVPCTQQRFNWQTLLEVDYQTNAIVANISVPGGATVLAYDPLSGLLYGGQGNNLSAIDPSTGTTEWTRPVPNATFAPSVGLSWYALAYDPRTGELVAPSTQDRLLGVLPENGMVAWSMSVPGEVSALAVDPATDQLFAATISGDEGAPGGSGVSVFNATTNALEAQLTIPSCVNGLCTEPDAVDQILIDPLHGDAYLAGETALFALNLSTLSIVGAVVDYGEGLQESTTFISSANAVVGTWWFAGVGPGFRVALEYSTVTSWTSFLWLPPALGELTLVVLAVVAVGFVSYRVVYGWWVRRKKRTAPPPVSPP